MDSIIIFLTRQDEVSVSTDVNVVKQIIQRMTGEDGMCVNCEGSNNASCLRDREWVRRILPDVCHQSVVGCWCQRGLLMYL